MTEGGIALFATCPASTTLPQDAYLRHVVDVARWSEAWGCAGILIHADNALVDPWIIAHTIIRHTRRLSPLVAVQPIYMHPYAVAKIVSTIAYLYGRRVFLHMVANGVKHDLEAINDQTPHERHYARLVEYTLIVKRLLSSSTPVTCLGEFYTIEDLTLAPQCRLDVLPGVFVSGSSDAGIAAAKAVGATAIKFPQPPALETARADTGLSFGARMGVIAREDSDEAWKIAHSRFPEDRRGQSTRLPTTKADSVQGPYWLGPFNSYKTMCPYLVGSYTEVVEAVVAYVRKGIRTFILDVPADSTELDHVTRVFSRVAALARA